MGELGRTLEGHTDRVVSVCVSADGSRLFSGSVDSTIKVWEVATGAVPFEGKQPIAISRLVTDKSKRPPLATVAPRGSVFSAAQWRLFTDHLIPVAAAAPGGCWAQDPATRPDAATVASVFEAADPDFPGDSAPSATHVVRPLKRMSKAQKRGIELNNGRAAQLGILGLMVHEGIDNNPYVLNDILGSPVAFNAGF